MDDIDRQLQQFRILLKSEPNDPRLDNEFSLGRYCLWADKMQHDFLQHITCRTEPDDFHFEEHGHIYMSYWYGALYVVVEGWQELKLTDSVIDGLLRSPNVDLLRRYRNGVFRFQRKFYDERFWDLMLAGRESVEWVSQLHGEFRRYFMSFFAARKEPRTAQTVS
jgi:hypothetical protein